MKQADCIQERPGVLGMVSAEQMDDSSQEVPAQNASGFSLFARKRKRSKKAPSEAATQSHLQDAGATPARPCQEERPAAGAPAADEMEEDRTTFKDLGVSDWLCRCACYYTHLLSKVCCLDKQQ